MDPKKKIYKKPELESLQFELGVFGSYGCDDGNDGGHDGGRRGGHRGGHRGGWISLGGWPFSL